MRCEGSAKPIVGGEFANDEERLSELENTQFDRLNHKGKRFVRITVQRLSTGDYVFGDSASEEGAPMATVSGAHSDSGVDIQLPISKMAARHHGKQGQENAFKGPLVDLVLRYLPCGSFAANQAFYLCGLLAQALLRRFQY